MPKMKILGAAALVLAMPCHAQAGAGDVTAILSVPASALVFEGDRLQPPDAAGHFDVGIKLPQPSIVARNCDTDNLIVGMGGVDKPEDALSSADRAIIAKERAYYDELVAAAKTDGTVEIRVRNKPPYLNVANGIVPAPYCTLSIAEDAGS
jgi:hypothetical protein